MWYIISMPLFLLSLTILVLSGGLLVLSVATYCLALKQSRTPKEVRRTYDSSLVDRLLAAEKAMIAAQSQHALLVHELAVRIQGVPQEVEVPSAEEVGRGTWAH